MKTFFALGSNPTLSISEIGAVLGHNLDYSQASSEILLLDEIKAGLGTLQNRVAGIIKTGQIIGSMPKLSKEELADFLFAYCYEYGREKKTYFGISIYNLDNPTLAKQLQLGYKALGLEIKKRLKESGQSARFVTGRDPALSSVIVKTNNLLESGGEFVLIATKDGIQIGQTQSVQDFKDWSDRDFGKPKRDPKRGMLPPKLARMMCNLGMSGSPITDRRSILDPFCGVGTVLIEAILLGFNQLIGTDIDQKAIADTEKNLNWFSREFDLQLPETRLETCPAQELGDTLTGVDPINTVVTEPYLGPLQKGQETAQEIKKTVNELTSLYIESFQSIAKLLNKEAQVVIVLPVFTVNNEEIYIPVIKELEQIGFHLIDPVPKSTPKELNKKTPRNGILYFRPHQLVAREILVFRYLP